MGPAFVARLRDRHKFAALAAVVLSLGATAVANADKTQASQTVWVQCADEYQFCNFTGTRTVRYGANSTWVIKELSARSGGTFCGNAVFGDPVAGVNKRCELAVPASSLATTIAGTVGR